MSCEDNTGNAGHTQTDNGAAMIDESKERDECNNTFVGTNVKNTNTSGTANSDDVDKTVNMKNENSDGRSKTTTSTPTTTTRPARLTRGWTRERLLDQATDITNSAREALRNLCLNTTAHGLHHIIEKDLHIALRLFWVCVTLASLALLVGVSYHVSYLAFVLRRPYTEVAYQDHSTLGLRLPDLTVCSLSRFWKSKLEAENVSVSLASYVVLAVGGPEVVSQSLKTDIRRAVTLKNDLHHYLTTRNITLQQLIIRISPTCKEVIRACYNGTAMLLGCDESAYF
ncbi:hypothetical protein Pmani_000008 [Petrolisthes manimaculis]|uniref:Uncharacterized protein n=1 Tax=Petrolisthes manimaculis TaxID=1843537 RepID=A0AAE1QMX0_9EUCA|nr:hypothetical protein Pmani_000008 [Petrolisthes manimaculis]